jgi:hypothetical protein
MILIYTALYLLIDRSRLRELLLYGSLLTVSFGYIDIAATDMGLWNYKVHFLPFKASLIPFTYTVHPIIHLFAYQYTSSWRSFIITNTLATAFFAFVAQPFYVWAHILWLGNWSYLYSFIMAGAVTFLARAVVIWLANIEQNHAPQHSRISLAPELQPAMKPFDRDNENE